MTTFAEAVTAIMRRLEQEGFPAHTSPVVASGVFAAQSLE